MVLSKSLIILITSEDAMKTLTRASQASTGWEAVGKWQRRLSYHEWHQKTLGSCQSGKGKAEGFQRSAVVEACLHRTFLLAVHIHLQLNYCLFLLCQVSSCALLLLWGCHRPVVWVFDFQKHLGCRNNKMLRIACSTVYLRGFNHNILHSVLQDLLTQLSLFFPCSI